MSAKARRIRSVLVANRGEIALRVVRTLRALGLRSVVAHSDIDAMSAAVELADDAVRLGPASAAESYLSIDAVIAAARSSDVDAIHPGYGFLSEREAFARAVEDAGLVFIGPTPENIRAMGDKMAARKTLSDAGIAIVPGTSEAVTNADELREVMSRLGLPVLLKAAAGGGGKGMRVLRSANEVESAFRLASSEAKNAFGDATLFAERYLEGARHVEVQVVGDGRGGAHIFPERDCSLQRRHQKLVEESPCPVLSETAREALLEAARKAVEVSRYRGAGTLEFLLTPDESFHFLEMNTRLQVEHPVTETVCGVDLVAEQIEVAGGATRPAGKLETSRVAGRGAAIEFRVNAEDPHQAFAPATGTVERAVLAAGPGVRVDSACRDGTEVSPHYDSLVAKIIAGGADRDEALRRLEVACCETFIAGVATTLPVARALLRDAAFRRGDYHCQTLEERLRDETFLSVSPPQNEEGIAALAVAAVLARQKTGSAPRRTMRSAADAAPSPWARLGRQFAVGGGPS